MSAKIKICVFYSESNHFVRAVRALRAAEPDSELVVMAPPEYKLPEELQNDVDSFIKSDVSAYSLKNPGACLSLVRQIRSEHYDQFAVMFDSTRLRILASLSGAKQRKWCRVDGRIARLHGSLPRVLACVCAKRIWGTLVYSLMYIAVRVFPSHQE